MGLLYTIPGLALTLGANGSASQDIFELVNGSTCSILVHQIRLTSLYNVDERVDVQLYTRTVTGSGGSSAVTPEPRGHAVASKITSFKTMLTTPASTGTNTPYEGDYWSQLAPFELLYTPEMRFPVPIGGRLCLNNDSAFVASSRTVALTMTWEELA